MLPVLAVISSSASAVISIALMIGVMFTAIIFMVGYFLQHPQIIALAKEELASLFFTVFIILFWLTGTGILNSLTLGLLSSGLGMEVSSTPGGSGAFLSGHVDLAIAGVEVMITKLKELYIDLYLYEATIGFLSTTSFPVGNNVFGVVMLSVSFAPFIGLTLLSNAHTTVVDFMAFTIGMLWSKSFILMFARDAVPLIFLPLGIILRSFPFFRSTGSSIIALAFAFYFVLPFAVLFSNMLIFDYYQPADLTYIPADSDFYGDEQSQSDVEGMVDDAKTGDSIRKLSKAFASPSVVSQSSTATSPCSSSNPISYLLCSFKNLIVGTYNAAKGFFLTLVEIFKFMLGFTGDFFWSLFVNPLMPGSTCAGLYYFIIKEVTAASQYLALVVLTTVTEILITVTMYRNISQVIGGELELAGITKVV